MHFSKSILEFNLYVLQSFLQAVISKCEIPNCAQDMRFDRQTEK